MLKQETRNVFIVVVGSIGMFLVLVAGFFLLCGASWGLMWGMNWAFVQLGFAPPFGGENGPVGLEIILGAFKIVIRLQVDPELRSCTEITRQAQSCIGSDGTLAAHNVVNAGHRHQQ